MTERFFDTNIVIDVLHDRPQAHEEIRAVDRAWISRMTWIEVMSGVPNTAAADTEAFLRLFGLREIDETVARRAAALRQQRRRFRSPDAIILASAQLAGWTLVTRNTRDFPLGMPGIRVPYQL